MIRWLFSRWLFSKANRLSEAQRYEEALECLRRAAEQAPRDLEIAAYLAEALYLTSRFAEAKAALVSRRAELERRREADPFEAPATGYLGRCCYHLGERDEARRWLEEALTRPNPMPDDRYFLALLLGPGPRAEQLLRELEADEPAFYAKRLEALFRLALERGA